jgi:putative ABC transport system substrate-binding protein
LALSILLLTLSAAVNGEQQARIPRVGYAASSGSINNPGVFVESFRRGLRDLGYIEGENILVEYRYPGTNPDRVSGFIEELIKLNVDVLVSSSPGAIG